LSTLISPDSVAAATEVISSRIVKVFRITTIKLVYISSNSQWCLRHRLQNARKPRGFWALNRSLWRWILLLVDGPRGRAEPPDWPPPSWELHRHRNSTPTSSWSFRRSLLKWGARKVNEKKMKTNAK
jgi:hypothetical protein